MSSTILSMISSTLLGLELLLSFSKLVGHEAPQLGRHLIFWMYRLCDCVLRSFLELRHHVSMLSVWVNLMSNNLGPKPLWVEHFLRQHFTHTRK